MDYVSCEKIKSIPIKWSANSEASKQSGYTLLIPSISFGNVPQLAVDLFISTFNFYQVGYLDTNCLHPVVGNDPFSEISQKQKRKLKDAKLFEIITALEVFENENLKLVLLQIRAPLIRGRGLRFVQQLNQFIKDADFSKVVILSSSDIHYCLDDDLNSSPEKYLANSFLSSLDQNMIELAGYETFRHISLDSESCPTSLHQCGYAYALFKKLTHGSRPCVILNIFVGEGDNSEDAISLANYSHRWMSLWKEWKLSQGGESGDQQIWKLPSSWNLFFGESNASQLYQ